MSFTSGTQALQGRTVNHDPYPNVWAGHSERDQMRTDTDMYRKGAPSGTPWMDYRHRPRPEYAVLDNPILAYVRDVSDFWDIADLARSMLTTLRRHERGNSRWAKARGWTPKQTTHARRVLEKLAAVYA